MEHDTTYLQRIDHLICDPSNIDILRSTLHMHSTLAIIVEQVRANQQLEQTTQEVNDCIWMRLARIQGLAAANQIGLLRILLYNDVFSRLAPFRNADGTFTPWLLAASCPANLTPAEPIQSTLQPTTTRSPTLDPHYSDR